MTGAAALIKEKQPDYSTLEIKSALLLGADWKAGVPATATDYDNKKTGVYDSMNKYGFGALNIAKSLEYSNDDEFPNIIRDTSPNNFPDQQYRITADRNDRVKVLLSWFIHPGNTIKNPTLPIQSPYVSLPNQFHNYDLSIRYPDGTIKRSMSDVQNNEFIVFDAPQQGHYTITVSSDGSLRTVLGEPYVIASTHPLDKAPFAETPKVPKMPESDLFETFDNLDAWTEEGERDWRSSAPDEGGHPPDHPSTNKVAEADNCDTECRLVLSDGLDLTGYQHANLELYRYVDESLESDEYLKIDISPDGGATWINAFTWTGVTHGDDMWHKETYNLVNHLDSTDFKIRAVAKMSSTTEEVMIDDLAITTDPDTAPVISPISDISLRHTGTRNIHVTAADAENNPITLSLVNPPSFVTISGNTIRIDPARSDVGTHTVIVRATANSLTDTESFTVRVTAGGTNPPPPPPRDTTPPVITPPPDVTLEATGVTTTITPAQLGTATARDNADPNPSISHDSPGSFRLGTHAITWTATDSSGNSASAIQWITIRDSVAPDITLVGDRTIRIEMGSTYEELSAVCTDAVDGDLPVTLQGTVDTGTIGTYRITYTCTDDSGNPASVSRTVTVRRAQDTTPPSITPPRGLIFEARGVNTTLNPFSLGTATVIDDTDPYPAVSNDFPGALGLGTHKITWTATDSSGNSASAIQWITIRDSVAPDITLVGDRTIRIEMGSTYEELSATCTDNIEGPLPVVQQGSADTRIDATYRITYSCSDTSGNDASVIRTVRVAPPSGTVHTVTPADFEYDINGRHHSCPDVVCLGFERIRTTEPQFVRFVISSGTVSDGDTVVFRDGTYDLVGPIVIRQNNLTIRSDDGSGVTIRSTDNKGLVFRNSADVSGLEIRWLEIVSSDTTRLAPARNFGMIFMEGEGYSDITIRNNTFHGDRQHAIRIGSAEPYNAQNRFSDVSILHNTFLGTPADRKDIHITNIDGVTISGNTFPSDDYIYHGSVNRLVVSNNTTPG